MFQTARLPTSPGYFNHFGISLLGSRLRLQSQQIQSCCENDLELRKAILLPQKSVCNLGQFRVISVFLHATFTTNLTDAAAETQRFPSQLQSTCPAPEVEPSSALQLPQSHCGLQSRVSAIWYWRNRHNYTTQYITMGPVLATMWNPHHHRTVTAQPSLDHRPSINQFLQKAMISRWTSIIGKCDCCCFTWYKLIMCSCMSFYLQSNFWLFS